MKWVSNLIRIMDLADGKGSVETRHNQPLMPEIVNIIFDLLGSIRQRAVIAPRPERSPGAQDIGVIVWDRENQGGGSLKNRMPGGLRLAARSRP
jgi:hypothetical protein